ncbi:C4-dicarboxylate ABC transporter substrate-binding protein [Salinarimonas soli]|uniref:C4-dicarboxylate ABC transporter substrate-binding protein n=1 Tax=Salinarimonas soli TaxID=1638099 RepID=A0A5B2VDR3_9HYPH|nr:C4-dicarboxylate ABC transporter substrate-binding protein [Salinarimonas soli]
MERLLRRLRRKEVIYTLLAVGLALGAAVAWVGYRYVSRPAIMTVAVGPGDGVEAKVLNAFAQALREQDKDVRLTVVPVDDVRASATALQDKRVDLALVRPDVMLPVNGLTVAVLREEAIILLAPTASGIEEVPNLSGKRLGVVTRHEADLPALELMLRQYDLAPPAVTLVPLAQNGVEEALRAKRVDAVAVVAAPVSQEAAAVLRAVAAAANRKVTVIPVDEAEAIALRTPALGEVTIPPGGLGGRPRQPEEEVKSVGISYRLMARADLDRGPVSKVAQHLFQLRSRIARDVPAVNLMKAPDTDTATSAALPNHQGAIDYFNREQLSFMDRYGDLVWMVLFFGGSLTSGLAWLARLFVRKRRELVDEVLDRLMCILSEARETSDPAALENLAVEVDRLVTHAIRYARHRTTGTRTTTALILAIDSARAAIADRRIQIEGAARRGAEPRARRAAIS